MESVEIVSKVLQREIDSLGGDASKVFLGGMSQGCVTTLATYLNFKGGILGGVLGASFAHVAKIDWTTVDLEAKKKTPLILYNGTKDPWTGKCNAKSSFD